MWVRLPLLVLLVAGTGLTNASAQGRAGSAMPVIQTLTVDSGGVVFAGTERNGVLKSSDGGRNWTQAGLEGRNVTALVSTPSGPLIAGITGWNGSIERSEDGGATWAKVENQPFVHALAVGPGGVIIAASRTAVQRSTDGGRSWEEVRDPASPSGVLSLAWAADGTLYAGGARDRGVFRSSDRGRSWSRVAAWSHGPVRDLLVDHQGGLFAGSPEGVFRLDPGGPAWVESDSGLPRGTVWAFALSRGGLLVAGTDSGTVASADYGRTWQILVSGGRTLALAFTSTGDQLLVAPAGSAPVQIASLPTVPSVGESAPGVVSGSAEEGFSTTQPAASADDQVLEGIVSHTLGWPIQGMVYGIVVETANGRFDVITGISGMREPSPRYIGGGSDAITATGARVRVRYRKPEEQPESGATSVEATEVTLLPLEPALTASSPVLVRGMGPVAAGMTVLEAAITARRPMTRELLGTCARYDRECWQSATACYYVKPIGLSDVSFMVVDGRIVRVDVSGGDVATAEGVRVGDREGRVRSVYAGNVEVKPHAYTDGRYLIVRPDGPQSRHGLVFETDGYVVTQYRAGEFPAVLAIEGCL